MARLPLVAIIGRPNTGKSTLFNRMVGSRQAIVSDVAGTTRDHIAEKVEREEVDFLLIDTGGIGGGSTDAELEDDVETQSMLAIDNADVILFTVNSRDDLTSSDREIAARLRKRKKQHVPVILVVTKVDHWDASEEAILPFQELGIGDEVLAVSASHGLGTDVLLESVEQRLIDAHFTKAVQDQNDETRPPRVAIIGKPNVGKSSLINAMMSDTQRSVSPRIVSDIPGTTRDSANTVIRYHERDYEFVDTAGLKRQAKTDEGIESYAMLRTIQALQDCDVAVMMVEAKEPITKQDKHIAAMVIEAGKGLILLVNKIDLLTTEEKKEKLMEIKAEMQFCKFAPILTVSTKTRENLLNMFDMIDMVRMNRLRRIPTKELHRWFQTATYSQPIGELRTCKHLTQAEDPPPTFILFIKNPTRVQVTQLRFLENRIRETFPFDGVPIRWITKGRAERDD